MTREELDELMAWLEPEDSTEAKLIMGMVDTYTEEQIEEALKTYRGRRDQG